MKNLLNRTTIPNTLPTDVPSCERLKTEVIQKPGAVYIPPPGAMIVPIPVPLPPTTGCPCPPGAYLNPTTNQCECCPRGKLYRSSSCDCGCPCPPGQELDPSYGRCVPCRSGATYDSKGCGCSCPCPDGQILLPGTGCVPTCPEGFTATYDTSEGLPRRCSVCVRQTSPGNPQISTCDGDSDCYRCETCIQGACVPKTCPRGQVLDFSDCACVPFNRSATDRLPKGYGLRRLSKVSRRQMSSCDNMSRKAKTQSWHMSLRAGRRWVANADYDRTRLQEQF